MTKFSPKWNPQYIELLRIHMSQGNSFMSFTSVVKVNLTTLYSWVKLYPEFKKVREEFRYVRPKLYA